MDLNQHQSNAMGHIRGQATTLASGAQSSIRQMLKMCNMRERDFADAVQKIRTHARVAVHFHPDRIGPSHLSVVESLLLDGLYKNQFETGLSNGHLSPDPGGPRDVWENSLFGDAYSAPEVQPCMRPKYGGLDLMLAPDGPCPRFGSCYFLLNRDVSDRCTFTFLDSHTDPAEKGTLDTLDGVLAALFKESFEHKSALGVSGVRPQGLVHHLRTGLLERPELRKKREVSRNLDHYLEAQVHGPVRLAEDVATLVADPSFQGTRIESQLKELCERFEIQLLWQTPRNLRVESVPADFRGPTMPSLASRIEKGQQVNAKIIGDAAAEVVRHPERWQDRGSPQQCLQELKQLWHVVVRYGETD